MSLDYDDDDDDDDDEWTSRARHKSSDVLSISETGGPSDVKRTSEGRELQFAEWLVNLQDRSDQPVWLTLVFHLLTCRR